MLTTKSHPTTGESLPKLTTFWLATAVMMLGWAGAIQAQTFRGVIVGTVLDQTGAPIPGATVTAKNEGTGLTRTVSTDDASGFNIPELPIGSYTITVEKSGLETVTQTGVHVDVAAERRVDVTLTAARVQATVEVRAQVPLVQSTTDVLGGTIESQQLENLPVNGRDYTKLIFLNPGVSGSPDQITDSPGSFGEFSVNGTRGRANNSLLDGTDMNDGYRNDPTINQAGVFGTPATILPVDAVAELAVLSNFAPEYGRNAGAVINIATKSGTTEFHGTAADYFRNSALDARNFFNTGFDSTTGGPPPKTSFHNNQFGGSLGGPIIKDKTFFFANYEGQQEVGGLNNTACVPSPDMIAAATAALPPGTTVNPVIARLLQRNPWPAPNLSPADSCPNVSATVPIFNHVNSFIGKIDHNFNEKNLLTGRYYYGTSNQGFPLGLGNSGDLPGFNTITPTDLNLLSLSYLKTLSPARVNEVRFGYNRFRENFVPQDSAFNPGSIGLNTGVSAQDYGLPNISAGSFASGPFAVGNFTPLGATHSVPRGRTDANWQFIDNFSWKFNRHEVKLGYEFRRTTVDQFFDETYRGTLSFSSLTDFLQGIPSGGSQVAGNSIRNTFQNSHAAYIQDSFRWSREVTLNLGVRWDYYGVITEENNLFSNYDPVNGLRMVNQLYPPDYKNFAPRISVAYDLEGKGRTVVRAGWGTFYDVFSQDFFLGHVPYDSSPPGPAYNGIGSKSISSNGAVTAQIVSGQPVYLNFGPNTNIFAVDPHLRTPYMFNYNLNIQHQISSNVVLQVGYVGSQGHKLFRFRDINQRVTPTAATLPNPNYGYVNYEESSANSVYNSLQAQLRIRGFKGFGTTMNYNYSHSIDNASDGEDFEPNASQPNNSYRPDLERSNSNFDIRHRFVWMANYALPKGSWQALGKLAEGWGLNSALTLQTGQPFQLNYNYSGDYDGTGEYFPRPDVVGNPYAGTSAPNNFINLTAFQVPCTFAAGACVAGTQHTGNKARNFLFGPPFKQWDFAIYKDTGLTERLKMQVRADFFNILNHPNFSNPFLPGFFAAADNNGIDPNTGRGIGFLPILATGDVGVGNPFLGGGGPRGIQIAVKFNF